MRRGLAVMALAAVVASAVVGCGGHDSTPSGPSVAGTISSSAARNLVDGRALATEWLNLRMPCPDPGPLDPTGSEDIVKRLGDRLPTLETVAKRLSTVNAKGTPEFVTGRLQDLEAARLQARYQAIDAAERVGVSDPKTQGPLNDFADAENSIIGELQAGVTNGKTLDDFNFNEELTCRG